MTDSSERNVVNKGILMGRFENRVCVVTGGGSGIGKATVKLFAKEGCKVVVGDVDDPGGVSAAQAIKTDGGQAIFVHTDVTKPGDAQRLIESCLEQFGRLDILANIAGVFSAGSVVATSEDVWDRVMSINLKGMYLCSKYAIPVMVQQGGGAIVNLASVSGLVAAADEAAYDASKGAVIMLTKSMALDFGKDKIRVNCVCPGNTHTPMIDRVLEKYANLPPETTLQNLANKNAVLKRLIRPEEVASVVAFLASDESSAATGGVYMVDGGWTVI